MSTLAPLLTTLSKSVVRHAAHYREALPRLPALAPYPEVSALAATLAPGSKFDDESRAGIVLALVDEQARAPAPLWSSLLGLGIHADAPPASARASVAPKDTDLDQEVLLAFLEAAVRVPSIDGAVARCHSAPPPHDRAARLRSHAQRRPRARDRRVRRRPRRHADARRHRRRGGAAIASTRRSDALEGSQRERGFIVSTCLEEVPLGTYASRKKSYPTLSRVKQAAMAETLRRQRSNALAAMARRGRKKRPRVEEVA